MTASAVIEATQTHPHWCSIGRCHSALQGPHESEPMRIAADGRGARLLMLLWQQPGARVRLRIVAIGDMLINEVDLDLDTAQLAQVTIAKLLGLTAPPD